MKSLFLASFLLLTPMLAEAQEGAGPDGCRWNATVESVSDAGVHVILNDFQSACTTTHSACGAGGDRMIATSDGNIHGPDDKVEVWVSGGRADMYLPNCQ